MKLSISLSSEKFVSMFEELLPLFIQKIPINDFITKLFTNSPDSSNDSLLGLNQIFFDGKEKEKTKNFSDVNERILYENFK